MSGNALHSRQTTVDGIHTSIAYVYADAAAREGAAGFIADDLHKLSIQSDDNSVWILTATTPTWMLVSASGTSPDANKIDILAIKSTAGTITKGQVVYITGHDDPNAAVKIELAKSDAGATMPAVGLAVESITDAATGAVRMIGKLSGLDTSTFAEKDFLLVSAATAGALTATRPTAASDFIQSIGEVLTVHASTGIVLIAGANRANDLPNLTAGQIWTGDSNALPVETALAKVGVQARRTTDLTLTSTWADITFDTTDLETNAAVLDHDLATNSDRILIGATGLYQVFFAINGEMDAIATEVRVRVNDTAVVAGSMVSSGTDTHNLNHNYQIYRAVLVSLTSGDYITLQAQWDAAGGTTPGADAGMIFGAIRL